MNTETSTDIQARPYHILEKASFVISFKLGLSPNLKNQVLSLFETILRKGVKIDRHNMRVIVENGYVERHENKTGITDITNLKTPCNLSVYPSEEFAISITYQDGRTIR